MVSFIQGTIVFLWFLFPLIIFKISLKRKRNNIIRILEIEMFLICLGGGGKLVCFEKINTKRVEVTDGMRGSGADKAEHL